ncbi:uncharacterized protein LOC131953816 [Physella acuta]|uniref:uncharacterized protein LOC131953816 n=1 Tax=Physella acuta TaxID=109671 RepID=UPI0027DC999D|nr:uncharacterized protein LOC131953816 [Physella acuta]
MFFVESVMLWFIYLWHLVMVSSGNDCENGYFGSRCQFRCNCNNITSCSVYGYCKKSIGCQPGWFYDLCQFRDLVGTSADVSPNVLETASCVVSSQLEVTMKRYKAFTFLRVTFGEAATASLPAVLQISSETPSNWTCPNLEVLKIDHFQLDFRCPSFNSLFGRLTLIFKQPVSICGINVSGGRPMFGVRGLELLHGRTVYGTALSTDPQKINQRFCNVRRPNEDITWRMAFTVPVKVQEIKLFFNVTSGTKAKRYTLSLLYASKKMPLNILYFDEPSTAYDLVPAEQVHKIEITTDMGSFNLCGLEIYGECLDRNYGLKCESECTVDTGCNLDGTCRDCHEDKLTLKIDDVGYDETRTTMYLIGRAVPDVDEFSDTKECFSVFADACLSITETCHIWSHMCKFSSVCNKLVCDANLQVSPSETVCNCVSGDPVLKLVVSIPSNKYTDKGWQFRFRRAIFENASTRDGLFGLSNVFRLRNFKSLLLISFLYFGVFSPREVAVTSFQASSAWGLNSGRFGLASMQFADLTTSTQLAYLYT